MIAVTGTGIVSPLGICTSQFLRNLRAGESAIGPLPPETSVAAGARFANPPEPGIDKRLRFLLDPVAEYAVMAAREAMQSASLLDAPDNGVGCIMGIGVCGIESIDASYHDLYAQNRRVSPFAIPKIMPAAPASAITMALGIRGPAFCTTSACASSAHAIICGALWLESGLADAVVVGGAEAPFAYGLLRAWNAMRVLANDTCRPFSVNRKGMVLGEGAAALILERLEDARARGANILAVLHGFAANADAGHIVKPDRESVAKVMRLALERSDLAPAEIGHVNAHATGTLLNDQIESIAVAEVFGEHEPYVSGTKGATGHTLGAAGAIEALISVHGLAEGWIPPTLNRLGPDPDCAQINVSPGTAVNARHEAVMTNSFAFGGLNAVLVFSRP